MDAILLTAIAAIAGAFGTCIGVAVSLSVHRRDSWTQVVLSRLDKYGEPDMLERIHLLHRFKKKHGDAAFASEFHIMKEQAKKSPLPEGAIPADDVRSVDAARRYYKHYFLSLAYLIQKRIISPTDFARIHTIESLKTLLFVVEPMEKAATQEESPKEYTPREYEAKAFELFRGLYARWEGLQRTVEYQDASGSCMESLFSQ